MADAGVASAIRRLGRTEDVRLSRCGRRLALAGYGTNRALVVDVRIDTAADPPCVHLSGRLEISSPSFDHRTVSPGSTSTP